MASTPAPEAAAAGPAPAPAPGLDVTIDSGAALYEGQPKHSQEKRDECLSVANSCAQDLYRAYGCNYSRGLYESCVPVGDAGYDWCECWWAQPHGCAHAALGRPARRSRLARSVRHRRCRLRAQAHAKSASASMAARR